MKANSAKQLSQTENDSFSSTTTIAALLFLAAKFPRIVEWRACDAGEVRFADL
jgi:hypothetical protein